MSKILDNKYEIGDTVYLKTDPDQIPRIVFCFMVFRSEVLYKIACGVVESNHYDFELSTEKNVLINA